MELPDDPDDPEEPDDEPPELAPSPLPPPLRWSVLSTCAALFLPGAFAVFFACASFAAPTDASVDALVDELVLGAVEVLGVVEPDAVPLYVDCSVVLAFEFCIVELLMPLVLLLGFAAVLLCVRGAALFLL